MDGPGFGDAPCRGRAGWVIGPFLSTPQQPDVLSPPESIGRSPTSRVDPPSRGCPDQPHNEGEQAMPYVEEIPGGPSAASKRRDARAADLILRAMEFFGLNRGAVLVDEPDPPCLGGGDGECRISP